MNNQDDQQETQEFDFTPEIHFDYGIAVKTVRKIRWNGDVAFDEHEIQRDGKKMSFQMNPEHGGGAKEIDYARLRQLEKVNPHTLPVSRILGVERATVEDIIKAQGLTVHFIEVAEQE